MAKRKRSAIVKELDKVFSQYIRLKAANLDGFAECVTCGKVDHWKKLQCGHFMSRRKYSTRWTAEPIPNCAPQCYGCNIGRQGEQFKFSIYLDQTYGEGSADTLLRASNETIKYSDQDLLELIEEFKQKLSAQKDFQEWSKQ